MKIIFEDDEWVEYEFTQPNDLMGDGEWWTQEDWDKWNKKMKELEENGTKGQLETFTVKLKKNPFLNGKIFTGDIESRNDKPTDSIKEMLESTRPYLLDLETGKLINLSDKPSGPEI